MKWLHGANMGIVLSTMATFGTYLGYQVNECDKTVGNPAICQYVPMIAPSLTPTQHTCTHIEQIRGGNGEMVVTGKTARQLHPILMGLAFLFFFLASTTYHVHEESSILQRLINSLANNPLLP